MANIDNFSCELPYGLEHLDIKVGGWSDPKFGYILNRAMHCLAEGETYLELGTFCGRSLIYALRNNNVVAHVIDPLPDSMLVGQESVWTVWNRNIDAAGIRDRIRLHRAKCEDFNESLSNVGVAFIDSNHDSGHTYQTLVKCESYLSNEAIIIVDDYNIFGGHAQTPYPGHDYEFKFPVRKDVARYVSERYTTVSVIGYTPYLNGQIYLSFRRSQ
jgi:predicted O-methyltransferase YrrM